MMYFDIYSAGTSPGCDSTYPVSSNSHHETYYRIIYRMCIKPPLEAFYTPIIRYNNNSYNIISNSQDN